MSWDNIAYLASGTTRQQAAYAALQRLDIFSILVGYDPILVGTIPIDLDTPNSDLDIICHVSDLSAFETLLQYNFSSYADFSLKFGSHNNLSVIVCNFTAFGFPFEIFGQPRPTKDQNGYRHMVAEARFLALAEAEARRHLRQLKSMGLKTEPAFAEYFALPGDPYHTLLHLSDAPDTQLQTYIEQAIQIKGECLFCQIVTKELEASIVYEDMYTLAFLNLRQANPGHVLVIPRRHATQIYDLDETLSARVMQTVVKVSRALKRTFAAPGLSIWQSNGEAAGQEIFHVHVHLFPRQHHDGHLNFYADEPLIEDRKHLDSLASQIREAIV
ncbi:MAG: DUF4269 domain-containing protein [Chloroflexota bacterium]